MNTTETTLAEALLRRKELNTILDRLRPIQENADKLFFTRVKRIDIKESTSEVTAHCPLITPAQIDAYFNYYARQLRLVDAVIQRANWDTKLDIPASIMADFEGDGLPKDSHPDAVEGVSE